MDHGSLLKMPRGILFDMDGTLIDQTLDFPKIKREMGIGERPLLEGLAELELHRQPAARAIMERYEAFGAESCALGSGCRELLAWMAQRQIPLALITRNSRRSAALVVQRHALPIEILITREDCAFKPSPAPLLLACQKLAVAPSQAWMVGDGQYDVEAGNAAGIPTVWLSHGRPRPFTAEPWKTARDLHELFDLLQASG